MKNTQILIRKTTFLTTLLFIVGIVCLSTGCKDDPKDPTISELKVCIESGIDNVLCQSNTSTFDEDTPAIYISGIFDNIDQNTNITFTLFGKDSNANWINLSTTTNSPSETGTFEDDVVRFRMNAFFKKSEDVQWAKTDYRIDVEIAGAQADDSVEFEVE